MRCMFRNSIIVRVGLLQEEIFSWRDFAGAVPNFDPNRLVDLIPPKLPSRRRTVTDDLIDNIVKGPNRTFDWTDEKRK